MIKAAPPVAVEGVETEAGGLPDLEGAVEVGLGESASNG